MKVYTKVVMDVTTGQIEYEEGYEYSGLIDLCKGPSATERQNLQATAAFTQKLSSAWSQMFAGQTNIISSLQTKLTSLLSKTDVQAGADASEQAAMRTQASELNAAQTQAALKAFRGREAALGGGNLPGVRSGRAEAAEAGILSAGAAQESKSQLGITQSLAERGYQRKQAAIGEIMQGTQLESGLLSSASTALSGYQTTGSLASQITQEEQAASPWTAITSGVGSAVGTAMKYYK